MSQFPQQPAPLARLFSRRIGGLSIILGLLSYLVVYLALRFQLYDKLGFGLHFWAAMGMGVVVCLAALGVLRALIARRGRFTLKKLLFSVLMAAALLALIGTFWQPNLEQRRIGELITARGGAVIFGDELEEPGWARLLGPQYFCPIRCVVLEATTLPEEDSTVLSRLPELDEVHFRGGAFTEAHARQIAAAPSLSCLSLKGTRISSGSLAPFAGHPGLKQFNVEGCTLDEQALEHLADIPQLRRMFLQGAGIADSQLAPLERCVQLRSLDLQMTSITDAGLVHLAKLSQLTSLSLQSAPITGSGLAELGKLPRLEDLNLNSTLVTDANLVHLSDYPSLTSVGLGGTQVSESGIRQLPLTRLKWLDVGKTKVTLQQMRQLEQEFPNLQVP